MPINSFVWALVNAVMNLWYPYKAGIFVAS